MDTLCQAVVVVTEELRATIKGQNEEFMNRCGEDIDTWISVGRMGELKADISWVYLVGGPQYCDAVILLA